MTPAENLQQKIMIVRVLTVIFGICGLLLGMAVALFASYVSTGSVPILQAFITPTPTATTPPTATATPLFEGAPPLPTPLPYVHPDQYEVILSDRMKTALGEGVELHTFVIALKRDDTQYMSLMVNVGNNNNVQGSRVTFAFFKEEGDGMNLGDSDSMLPVNIKGKDNSFYAVAQAFRIAVAEADRIRLYDYYRPEGTH